MEIKKISFDEITEEDWTKLLQESQVDTLFQTYIWNKIWWEVFHEKGDLELLTIEDDEGLSAIFPMYSFEKDKQTIARVLGGMDVTDYQASIIKPGKEIESFQKLFDYAEDQDWDSLEFHFMPEVYLDTGAFSSELTYASRSRGVNLESGVQLEWDVEKDKPESESKYCPTPILNFRRLPKKAKISGIKDQGIANLLEHMRSSRETKLRKKGKKRPEGKAGKFIREDYKNPYLALQETNHEFLETENIEEVEGDVNRLIEMMKKNPKKADFFRNDFRREFFFREIAKETFKRDWLRLKRLEVDGNIAAMLMCFDYKNRFWNQRFHDLQAYNTGFDLASHSDGKKLGLGKNLFMRTIVDAVSEGYDRFNFLRGGENYKYDFGVRDDLLYSFKTGGTAVIHSWARDLSFNQLIRHVTDNPAYRLITKEKFVYPSQKKIPSDECEWNLYGQGAISKARKLAEEHESSLVLLHVKRGIGQLDLQADLYEKN